MSGTDATPDPARSYEPRRRELLDDMTAHAAAEEIDAPPGTDHADRIVDTRPSTSDRFTVDEPVVFIGYAPSKPEIPGTVTHVLARPADHHHAGQVTGYIVSVDGAHGQTLCAEPHQAPPALRRRALRRRTVAPPTRKRGTCHRAGLRGQRTRRQALLARPELRSAHVSLEARRMTAFIDPNDPAAVRALLVAALHRIDVVRPPMLQAPLRDMLRAKIELCDRTITARGSLLGRPVAYELRFAKAILDVAQSQDVRFNPKP